MSRWIELYATSPSGKTLFVCKMCGRTTPAPDRECPAPPEVVSWKGILPCIVLEEMEDAMAEVAVSVGSKDLKNKTAYKVTLTSASTALVQWEEVSGATIRQRKKSIHLNFEKLDKLLSDAYATAETAQTTKKEDT